MVELIEIGGERGLVDGGGDHRHGLRLELHRLADPVGRALHFFDRVLDRAVGFDRLASRLLDRGDLGRDVVGRPSGLRGEALHFLSDDRKSAPGVARPRRLDRGVEREEVGLARDVADQAENQFNRLDVGRQRLADLHRLACLIAGAGCDPGRDLDFGAGVLDRPDEAGGGLRRLAHGDRRLLGGGGDFAGLAEHPARRSGGRAGAIGQRLGLVGAGAHQFGDAALELLALAAAHVGGLDRFEQRDLGKDDVGFDNLHALERADALLQLGRIAGEALDKALDDCACRLCARGHVGRHGASVGEDPASIFGNSLDPGGVDLLRIESGVMVGALLAEVGRDLRGDQVERIVAQDLDVAIERSARVISC